MPSGCCAETNKYKNGYFVLRFDFFPLRYLYIYPSILCHEAWMSDKPLIIKLEFGGVGLSTHTHTHSNTRTIKKCHILLGYSDVTWLRDWVEGRFNHKGILIWQTHTYIITKSFAYYSIFIIYSSELNKNKSTLRIRMNEHTISNMLSKKLFIRCCERVDVELILWDRIWNIVCLSTVCLRLASVYDTNDNSIIFKEIDRTTIIA